MKIKPIQYGRNSATKIEINLIDLQLFKNDCNTYWQIKNDNEEVLENGNTPIPEEIYLKWLDNDSVIANYVLTQLQLEKDE